MESCDKLRFENLGEIFIVYLMSFYIELLEYIITSFPALVIYSENTFTIIFALWDSQLKLK